MCFPPPWYCPFVLHNFCHNFPEIVQNSRQRIWNFAKPEFKCIRCILCSALDYHFVTRFLIWILIVYCSIGSSSVLAFSRKVCYHAVPSGITNAIIIIIVTRPSSWSLSPPPPLPSSPHHLQASWDGVEPLHGDLIGDRWWKPSPSFCHLSGENNLICKYANRQVCK